MRMKTDSRTHALLATARIANVPSVVSNLGVGVFLGWVSSGSASSGSAFEWPWLLSLAAILFYIGGNFFNDFKDLEWDRSNRPERALPRGLFQASTYHRTAMSCFFFGLVICAYTGWKTLIVGGVLVGLIELYTRTHKRTPLAVVPMGLCRACLPVLGFVWVRDGVGFQVLYPATALLVYVIALSISARWESRGRVPVEKALVARGALVTAGIIAAALPMLVNPLLGWIGLIPFGIWLGLSLTKFRSPVSAHVSALLAGIPLVDWIPLLPIALMWHGHGMVVAADAAFIIAVLLPPAAFVLGRMLQRLAPAT